MSQTTTTLKTVIREAFRTKSDAHGGVIDRIFSAPQVQKFIQTDEAEQLAARAAKVKALAAIPGQFESSISGALKRHAAAAKRTRSLEQELREAQAAELAGYVELNSVAGQRDNLISRAQMELVNGADERLEHALRHLDDLRANKIRNAVLHGVAFNGDHFTNADDCNSASDGVAAAINEVRSMQVQALSSNAVDEKLAELFAKIDQLLAPIELRAPRLRDGSVFAGLPFGVRE